MTHRELINEVKGSVAFSTYSYDLNPGLARTFPWLATQAAGYQLYQFRKLTFVLAPKCATSVTGTAILQPEYNPTDRVPKSETEMSNTSGAVSDIPWKEIQCQVDCKMAHCTNPWKQIRAIPVASMQAYDIGKLNVGTVGQAGATVVSGLWVEYQVILRCPQTTVSGLSSTTYTVIGGVDQVYVNGTVAAQQFDTVTYNRHHVSLAAGGLSFQIQPGLYLMTLTLNGHDTVVESRRLQAQWMLDGVADGPYRGVPNIGTWTASNTLHFTHVIEVTSATNVLSVNVTMNGAAGVLMTEDVMLLICPL